MTGPKLGAQYLFTDQVSNATSTAVNLNYPNGRALVTAWSPTATWDSAQIQLFYLMRDGTQVPVSQDGTIIVYTGNQGLLIEGFPYGEQLVAVMTNSNGGSDVTVIVEPVAGS